MHAILKKDWRLRGWTNIKYAIVNYVENTIYPLSKDQFYVLNSANGLIDFTSLAFCRDHHKFLRKAIAMGLIELCPPNSRLPVKQRYKQADSPLFHNAIWAVTGACNLKCRHCFMQSPSNRYGELSLDNLERIADVLTRANIQRVTITGGEPFVRSDFTYLIDLLNERDIHISSILTNAVSISEHHIDRLLKEDSPPDLQISFDGFGGHDMMRGVMGVQSIVLRNISRLKDAGFHIDIATAIDLNNCDSLLETYNVLKDKGVDSWTIARPSIVGAWRKATSHMDLQQSFNSLRKIYNTWKSDGTPFHINFEQFSGVSEKSARINNNAEARSKSTLSLNDDSACRDGIQAPYILPNGTILRCAGFVDSHFEQKMPNLLHGGLSEAWENQEFRHLFEIRRSERLDKNEECIHCEHLDECNLGCMAKAYQETGSLYNRCAESCQLWRSGLSKMLFNG